MNWYKLYKKSQTLYDHYFEREPVDDYEEYYPPFEEGKSELSNTQHHYHGRNVIWVAEEGQTLWVDSNDVYPIEGNKFNYEKVNGLMDRIGDAEDKIYLYAPTGTATKVDSSEISPSSVSFSLSIDVTLDMLSIVVDGVEFWSVSSPFLNQSSSE